MCRFGVVRQNRPNLNACIRVRGLGREPRTGPTGFPRSLLAQEQTATPLSPDKRFDALCVICCPPGGLKQFVPHQIGQRKGGTQPVYTVRAGKRVRFHFPSPQGFRSDKRPTADGNNLKPEPPRGFKDLAHLRIGQLARRVFKFAPPRPFRQPQRCLAALGFPCRKPRGVDAG